MSTLPQTAPEFYASHIDGYLTALAAQLHLTPCTLKAIRAEFDGVVAVSRERFERIPERKNWRGETLPALMGTRLYEHRLNGDGTIARSEISSRTYTAHKGFYHEIVDCEYGFKDYTLFGRLTRAQLNAILNIKQDAEPTTADAFFFDMAVAA